MATLGLMGTSDSKYGTLRHMLMDPTYKRMGQGVCFSEARVSNEVASQWISRSRALYVTDKQGSGD